jgi:hypothetical protein
VENIPAEAAGKRNSKNAISGDGQLGMPIALDLASSSLERVISYALDHGRDSISEPKH